MSTQTPFPNEPLGDLILQKFGSVRALSRACRVPMAVIENALRGIPISRANADKIERALGTAVYIDRKD